MLTALAFAAAARLLLRRGSLLRRALAAPVLAAAARFCFQHGSLAAPARVARCYRPAETAEVAMKANLLRSPLILHTSDSSIGEWKALAMENAMV